MASDHPSDPFFGEWDAKSPPQTSVFAMIGVGGVVAPADDSVIFTDITQVNDVPRMEVPKTYWVAMVLLDWYISCIQFTYRQAVADATNSKDKMVRKIAKMVAKDALEHAYYHMRWRTIILKQAKEMIDATEDVNSVTIPLFHQWLWRTAFNKHHEKLESKNISSIEGFSFDRLEKDLGAFTVCWEVLRY